MVKQWKWRVRKEDAAVCLIDHQVGLLSLVRDFSPAEFKNNVLAVCDIAKTYNMPTILTTSFEDGPNGVLMPEVKAMFPNAPFIPRPGQISAWDNEDFVNAVKATGKKQLIMCGIVTEICVAFPVLSALEEGYEVFVIVDASGTFNETTRNAALDRMSKAGAHLLTWFGLSSELQVDWRDNGDQLKNILHRRLSEYDNLIVAYETPKGKK